MVFFMRRALPARDPPGMGVDFECGVFETGDVERHVGAVGYVQLVGAALHESAAAPGPRYRGGRIALGGAYRPGACGPAPEVGTHDPFDRAARDPRRPGAADAPTSAHPLPSPSSTSRTVPRFQSV